MSNYGCFNKPRPTADSSYIAQFGWAHVRGPGAAARKEPIHTVVNAAFGTTDCQYTLSHAADPECSGCVHRAKVTP